MLRRVSKETLLFGNTELKSYLNKAIVNIK